MLNLINNNQII